MEPRYMAESDIIKMYTYPDPALVEHAVQRVNLTDDELEVVRLHLKRGLTLEKTAEVLGITLYKAKDRWNSAKLKLQFCWGSLPWVESVINQPGLYSRIKQ